MVLKREDTQGIFQTSICFNEEIKNSIRNVQLEVLRTKDVILCPVVIPYQGPLHIVCHIYGPYILSVTYNHEIFN